MDVPESYSIVKNSDVAFLRLLPILSNFNCSYCVMSSPDVAGMTTRAPRLARTHTVSASAADAGVAPVMMAVSAARSGCPGTRFPAAWTGGRDGGSSAAAVAGGGGVGE